MKIDRASFEWTIKHLDNQCDTDLFPRLIEIDVIKDMGEKVIDFFSNLDLTQISPGPARRFIVPKDDLSYRTATQLDPLDSIFLTAIMYQYGQEIENKRYPVKENKIFSYRFSPSPIGIFYNEIFSWNKFWEECYKKSKKYKFGVILDISDYYNQIYHHSLENQLASCGLPNQIIKWIMNLLGSITAKTSRGIPVGPHATHLLAEASIIPIDNSLTTHGIDFCRFVDDILIFCNSNNEARSCILQVADILDKQQRLILQRNKTKVLDSKDLQNYCLKMIEDRPVNDIEKDILGIIKKYSGGNPYAAIFLSQLSDEEIKKFHPDSINKILNDYLSFKEPDYIRLKWFIRRLSQTGSSSAIDFCLKNFNALIPAISDICRYFISVNNYSDINWKMVGKNLLFLLENEIIKSNGYYQLSVYSLFNRKIELNHFEKLVGRFNLLAPILKREVIISGYKNKRTDWIRELKEHCPSMDTWSKRAFIIASSILPKEEKRFLLKEISLTSKLDEILIEWARN